MSALRLLNSAAAFRCMLDFQVAARPKPAAEHGLSMGLWAIMLQSCQKRGFLTVCEKAHCGMERPHYAREAQFHVAEMSALRSSTGMGVCACIQQPSSSLQGGL